MPLCAETLKLCSLAVSNTLPDVFSRAFRMAFYYLLHKRMTRVISDRRPHRSLYGIYSVLPILNSLGLTGVSPESLVWMEWTLYSNHDAEERYDPTRLMMGLLEKPASLPIQRLS